MQRANGRHPPFLGRTEVHKELWSRQVSNRIRAYLFLNSRPRRGETMPPRTMPPSPTETPTSLRQRATRARRLAADMTTPRDQEKLIEFAKELEARAAAVETTPPTSGQKFHSQ